MLYTCDKKCRMSRAFVFDKIDLDKGLLVVSWIVYDWKEVILYTDLQIFLNRCSLNE